MLTELAKAGVGVITPSNSNEGPATNLIPELEGVYVDQACQDKLDELTDEERAELYEAFRIKGDIQSPSKWLFSKARTVLIDRTTGRGGRAQRHGNASGGAVPSTSFGSLLQHDPDVNNEPVSEEVYAELMGLGADDQAIEKVKELPGDEQMRLANEFVSKIAELQSPAKWLFSAARTRVIDLKTGRGKRPVQNAGGPPAKRPRMTQMTQPIFDPPLDAKAQEKLAELEQGERDDVLYEFQQANTKNPILNPSGWVFGRARTKLIDKQTGRRPPNGRASGGASGGQDTAQAQFLRILPTLDLEAQDKLQELDQVDLQDLMSQFQEANTRQMIKNPSGWVFAKARTKLATRAVKGGGKGSMTLRHSPVQPGLNMRAQTRPQWNGNAGAPALDEEAQAKLDELGPTERADLLREFQEVSARDTIKNPSGWIFGKARTKLARQATGGATGGARRLPPSSMLNPSMGIIQVLDEGARSKLEELDPGDRDNLLREFQVAQGRETIKNPSGWVFGKARSILVSKQAGRRR